MTNPLDPARSLFRITGADRVDFLQGLVSNNLTRLDAGVVYTAFLSPQGK
jgi:folate-binding Fe-S cluster repair protein YgfZ